MSKLCTGAEIVFKCLEDQDVEFIFGYPGGAVLPIYDELKNHKTIKIMVLQETYVKQNTREVRKGFTLYFSGGKKSLHLDPELPT